MEDTFRRAKTLLETRPIFHKRFRVRIAPVGEAGKALQAVGVALGPSVRILK